MSVDTIGNFLTIVRNAVGRANNVIDVAYSNLKYDICRVLEQEGFIHSFVIEGEGLALNKKRLKIKLKYVHNESVIHEITQVSTPGRRVYVRSESIPTVINGLGIAVLTTSKGVMTDKQARSVGVGGELICTVW